MKLFVIVFFQVNHHSFVHLKATFHDLVECFKLLHQPEAPDSFLSQVNVSLEILLSFAVKRISAELHASSSTDELNLGVHNLSQCFWKQRKSVILFLTESNLYLCNPVRDRVLVRLDTSCLIGQPLREHVQTPDQP